LRAGQDSLGQDVLVLSGPEPDMRWKGFSDALADLAAEFGVRLLVGLGAFPAPVPHTRSAPLAATASNAELAQEIGIVPGVIDVSAGVLAALERRLNEVGVPTIGIWARVPHYVAGMPYPEASKLLLEGLAKVSGVTVDTTALNEAAEATRARLDELTANSPQHAALVSQLETQFDEDAQGQALANAAGWGDLPSGDELAEEFERYLRDEG
jgi:predicted ATP-grasp superfamily ATP-dependent carboligase